MSESSSPLDLNTLWVEYKNRDGRVSYFNYLLSLNINFIILDLFLQC